MNGIDSLEMLILCPDFGAKRPGSRKNDAVCHGQTLLNAQAMLKNQ